MHVLVWALLVAAVAIPIVMAANSPLLQWRDPVYIAGGFAGIVALALLLFQPLLIGGLIPGLRVSIGRQLHRWFGMCILATVIAHVAGLWITSPPDVMDALTFTSPTPFSVWGVVAMWAVFATAFLALSWRRVGMSSRVWRRGHFLLAVVIAVGSVIHALQIEGAMEPISKFVLCSLVIAAVANVLYDRRRGL